MKISIVVPTYLERDNIQPLVERIDMALQSQDYELVLVDDNSPDGTVEFARNLANKYAIKVINRRGVRGLGSAILEGFRNAQGDVVGVIDADLQHPPEIIPRLVSAIENGADIAIASRYVPGAGVGNWSTYRRAVSKGAIILAKPITNVKDPMSGCFFLRSRLIEEAGFTATGYKILLEILVKGKYNRVKEVPYVFTSRHAGKSKLGLTEYPRYLRLLSHLYWYKAKSKLSLDVRPYATPGRESFTGLPPSPPSNSRQDSVGSNIKLTVSVGVCAYNEEMNIGNLLKSLRDQSLNKVEINQIVVVSSACRDRTDEIIEGFRNSDQRIKLVRQANRKGKASAVNLFLQVARGNICILISADTSLPRHSIECLCLPFYNLAVGMTGGHPIPINDPSAFMGFVSHFIWQLAHELSLVQPKLGEYIAFRNIVDKIPEDTAVDEAAIEAEVKRKGYSLQYVPEAEVYNRGTTTVSDFVKQRRRIYAGHLHLRKTDGYEVSSMGTLRLLKLVAHSIKPNWRSILWTPAAMLLEFYSRVLGSYDFYVRRENPYIWEVARSTKTAIKK